MGRSVVEKGGLGKRGPIERETEEEGKKSREGKLSEAKESKRKGSPIGEVKSRRNCHDRCKKKKRPEGQRSLKDPNRGVEVEK